jgi:ribosomal protein S18 acetylase RimI-like enzyme
LSEDPTDPTQKPSESPLEAPSESTLPELPAPDLALVSALEERAFAAWPAEEVKLLDGWRLRHMRGVTRRANSVWPSGDLRELPPSSPRTMPERLAEVETFYRDRGQPAMYQLSPVAAPVGLDEVLAARGYQIEAPVEVQVADVAPLVQKHRPMPGVRTEITAVPSARWFEVSALRGRFAAVADVYRGLLGRLGERAVYVLAEHRGVPAAVGLGVVDRDWMGLFAMSTLPELRRMGLGTAVLGTLAGAAAQRGATRLYLQVEVENTAARHLYAAGGFMPAYRYHYRIAPRPADQTA